MRIFPLLILLLSGVWLLADPACTNQLDALTLKQAQELAERQHPQLAEARARVEAAAGTALQAGALPNPSLVVGAQQLPLDRDGSNQREYVAGVSQPIPLGGRLSRARDAALFEQEVAARGLDVTRRELRKRVHNAFATALYQEKACDTQHELLSSAQAWSKVARSRVDAGDVTPDELSRAEVDVARAKLELQRAEVLREQALHALAGSIGDPTLRVASLHGELTTAFDIPALSEVASNLVAHPELLHARADAQASELRAELARAERIPDVNVEVLYHRLEATKENTLDVGLSIPLPLFSSNRGNEQRARAGAEAATARARRTADELELRANEAYARLTTTLAEAEAFESDILPRAASVLRVANARYGAGDINFAEVLPERRAWAETQMRHLEAMRNVMQAWAEVASYLKEP